VILLDTNIIIELFKGNEEIISKIEKIGAENIILSKITVVEMYVGALDKIDLKKIKKYLAKFPKIEITDEIFNLTIDLIEKYYLSHSLYINDAIIAATCIKNNFELFTLNLKDFKFIENLQIIKN